MGRTAWWAAKAQVLGLEGVRGARPGRRGWRRETEGPRPAGSQRRQQPRCPADRLGVLSPTLPPGALAAAAPRPVAGP